MPGEVTLLLQAANGGDEQALNRLVALLYVDLRHLAHRFSGRGAQSLNTTSLVHECYLRLLHRGQVQISDRHHFLSMAARIMRQVLCDHSRERLAKKRGAGAVHHALSDLDAAVDHQAEQMLALDQALDRLSELSPVQVHVVECRYFAGLSEQETAECLDRPLRSVQRDWATARRWLEQHLAS